MSAIMYGPAEYPVITLYGCQPCEPWRPLPPQPWYPLAPIEAAEAPLDKTERGLAVRALRAALEAAEDWKAIAKLALEILGGGKA